MESKKKYICYRTKLTLNFALVWKSKHFPQGPHQDVPPQKVETPGTCCSWYKQIGIRIGNKNKYQYIKKRQNLQNFTKFINISPQNKSNGKTATRGKKIIFGGQGCSISIAFQWREMQVINQS